LDGERAGRGDASHLGRGGIGVTTTQAFDPNTGLAPSILAGSGSSVSNQAFTFDTLGRLTSRSWLNTSGGVVKENSCFDGLNRLASTLITSGTACTGSGAVTMTYDALGNLTSKSDICATAGCFAYGGSGAGPHALTSVTGVVNGVTNPTFVYDADGTMTSGAGRTITPTTFNMAASMTSGANTVWFGYDPDHARYKMVSSGLNAGTTYYMNDAASGAMEEREVVAGVTTWRDYIMADGKLIAQRQCVGPPPCSSGASMLYFILDHLGSVTVVTDGSGNVLQRLSYDAWGKRRNADGSALSCAGGLAQPNGVSRGFTGQEMIDALCLVNLNARVYDPTLGRFLSADPVVGDATVPQELNRFSYVLNDPLSLTDPSGLCFLGCFWKSPIFREVLAIAFVVVFQQEEFLPALEGIEAGATVPTALAFVNAGILGGVSGLISSGGSLKGAALGALEADLFLGVGNALTKAGANGFLGFGHVASAFISHGLVGGLTSELGGGSFGSGFLSAGIGSLAPVPTGKLTLENVTVGTAEAAVLGGVGSVLGGGKFQNGAETGAFGYLFNEIADRIKVAQEEEENSRRGLFDEFFDPTAELRQNLWNQSYDALKRVAPYDPDLTFASAPGWIPSWDQVSEIQARVSSYTSNLQLLRPSDTLKNSPGSSYSYWNNQPTSAIVQSLGPYEPEPLRVGPNGTIWQGNTRVFILQQRGYPVNSLPRAPKIN
jgi:RHS repeat-associated protein